MTFRDWVDETIERYRTQPATRATYGSADALLTGINRRTVDPMVGRSIWEREDWDVLVVADAARTDMMREAITEYDELPDNADAVWSNASCSIDWINRTFNGYPEEARRTGYVTANPFTSHDEEDTRSADLSEPDVGHLRLLYETEWQDVGGGIETVPPERVTDHAIDAWRRRDELDIDRLVIHYMQPHEPFRARPEWGGGDHVLLKNLVSEGSKAGASIYPKVRAGEVPLDEFREVYLDNHHWLLEDISERLLGNIDGRVAVTADHGNGLGDWWSWHHPPGRIAPPIRRVPWFTVDSLDGQTVTPDVQGQDSVDAETADQLEALGYT